MAELVVQCDMAVALSCELELIAQALRLAMMAHDENIRAGLLGGCAGDGDQLVKEKNNCANYTADYGGTMPGILHSATI